MPEGTTTRRKLQESPTARKLSQTRRIRKLRTSTGRLAMASTRHLRNSNADGRCGNAVRVAIETTVTDAEKKLNSAKNMKKVKAASAKNPTGGAADTFKDAVTQSLATRRLSNDRRLDSAEVLTMLDGMSLKSGDPVEEQCEGFNTLVEMQVDHIAPQNFGYIADELVGAYALTMDVALDTIDIVDAVQTDLGVNVIMVIKTCTAAENAVLEGKLYDSLTDEFEKANSPSVGMDGEEIATEDSPVIALMKESLEADTSLPATLNVSDLGGTYEGLMEAAEVMVAMDSLATTTGTTLATPMTHAWPLAARL